MSSNNSKRSIHDVLVAFSKNVVKSSRANLSRKGYRLSNALYKSLGYEVKTSKASFSLSISMEDYGAFLDRGVKGADSSSRAPNSPYRFGTGSAVGGRTMADIMTEWARNKGVQFRDKQGRYLSHAQTGFIIARDKYRNGTKPTNFFTGPFESQFKKLPDEIVEAYGLELDDFINFSLDI